MGRASRWLRSLLSGTKERKEPRDITSNRVDDRPEKRRWSFRKSKESGEIASGPDASTAAAIEAAWFRSFYARSDKAQSKHAIALAAAAMRLASPREQHELAAERIQTAFRGYLARKARRALKALVKLQALVRGYLVRKQAAAALHSMQALLRAQAAARAQRSRNLLCEDTIYLPEIRHRRSIEKFNDPRTTPRRLSSSVDGSRSPRIIEMIACRPKQPQLPLRISIPSRRGIFQENEHFTGDRCRAPATAHSTPRCLGSSGNAAVTPAKSVCIGEGVFRQYSGGSPSYMANTKSSKAKLRPHSEVMARKRQPLGELNLDARASNLVAVGMQKNCSLVQEAAFDFKSAVVGKLEREAYLQKRW